MDRLPCSRIREQIGRVHPSPLPCLVFLASSITSPKLCAMLGFLGSFVAHIQFIPASGNQTQETRTPCFRSAGFVLLGAAAMLPVGTRYP